VRKPVIILLCIAMLLSTSYLAADTRFSDTFDLNNGLQPISSGESGAAPQSPGPRPGTLATVLSENFSAPWIPCGTGYDAPPGWVVDGIPGTHHWAQFDDAEVGQPTSNSTPYSAGVWWSSEDPAQDEWLITPALDLSASMNTKLYFNSIYTMPSFGTDPTARDLIEVSTDGGLSWTILGDLAHDPQFEIPGATGGPAGTHWCWYEMYLPGAVAMPIDLSAYDFMPSVKIAFHYDIPDTDVTYGIWCVDDVLVVADLITGMIPHTPIRINSNADFNAAHGVTGGNGTVWAPWIIENYDINGTGYGYCIYVGNTTDYFTIQNCYLHEASGNPEIYFGDASIYLFSVQNGNLSNNIAISNGIGYHLRASSHNIILFNNASLGGSGIYLYNGCNNNIIKNNTVGNHSSVSIYIQTSCNSNMVLNNTVSKNYFNIRIQSSSNGNVVANNYVSDGGSGISLSSVEYNTIYHNQIINNTYQAYNGPYNNWWNLSYPTGGNYWSNYTGIDVKWDTLQNQPGSDGIGDTPYIITANFTDNYPLMSPFDYTEYNISLQQGWNMISLPLRQLSVPTDSILESIAGKYDYIQAYNSSNPTSPWESFATFRPASLNNLNSMNHLRSYWIHITEPGLTLTVKGDKFGSALSIPLKAGWNLVGYPSLAQKPVSEALTGTGYDSVEGFNVSDPYRTSVLLGSYMMKPGEGYWVHVPADTVWVVNW
jgi:parallel beta-helix repeat protein